MSSIRWNMENCELKMNIIVPVKRVVDPYVKIRVNQDGTGVETHQVKMVMNPFDEIALEEALRLKEKGIASEVICLSIGDIASQETLRHGLALGADRAILVETSQSYDSLEIAKILKKIIEMEGGQLVLMGKQAIDSDANQTPQMLAGLLDWPQVTFISKIDVLGSELQVVRETDSGLEHMQVQIPAIVSVDLRLNEPRYATLPNIMKSKSKPLKIVPESQLDWGAQNTNLVLKKVHRPPTRAKGQILQSVDDLIEKLKPLIQS